MSDNKTYVRCLACREVISTPESGDVGCSCFNATYERLAKIVTGMKKADLDPVAIKATGLTVLRNGTGVAFKEQYGYNHIVAIGPYEIMNPGIASNLGLAAPKMSKQEKLSKILKNARGVSHNDK